MRKPKIYIETSIWSHLFAEDAPKEREDTESLFAEIKEGYYEIYISELVATEINRTPDSEKRGRLQGSLERYRPVILRIEDEATALADQYLEERVIPRKAIDDALHVAVASVEEMDIIASLNMGHIVRLKTRMGIAAVKKLQGYKEIEIATPEEVLGYGREEGEIAIKGLGLTLPVREHART